MPGKGSGDPRSGNLRNPAAALFHPKRHMAIYEASVRTANAGSYLRKLCQHWSHRFEVQYDDQHGIILLPQAKCVLTASPETLLVRLACSQGADGKRVQEVVEEHVRRFGFREELEFPWTPVGA